MCIQLSLNPKSLLQSVLFAKQMFNVDHYLLKGL